MSLRVNLVILGAVVVAVAVGLLLGVRAIRGDELEHRCDDRAVAAGFVGPAYSAAVRSCVAVGD
ncbi:MAG: hypothetical protein FWF90_15600 [Promicromonosporaceae bacterium]|nr:hypothetical protein [Promicromonosporaceae bacterium]